MIAAAKPFNADFYATAATVIPVLFLALMFPGAPVNRVLVATRRWRTKGEAKAMGRRANVGFFLVGAAEQAVLILLVVFGSFGELCAIVALYNRHATTAEASGSLHSLEYLVGLTGLSVIVAVVFMVGSGGGD